jgi:hypothetical protein
MIRRNRRVLKVFVAMLAFQNVVAQEFRITQGRGYTVCESYLRNLNRFRTLDPNRVCEQEIHPNSKDFSYPVWNDLPQEENLQMFYDIEKTSHGFPVEGADISSFENWRKQYEQRLEKPRVRTAEVRAPRLVDGAAVTVLEYDTVPSQCEGSIRRLGKPVPDGKWYFIYQPQEDIKLIPIIGAAFPGSGRSLLLYGKTAAIFAAGAKARMQVDAGGNVQRTLDGYAVWVILSFIEDHSGKRDTSDPLALARCQFETPSKILTGQSSGSK